MRLRQVFYELECVCRGAIANAFCVCEDVMSAQDTVNSIELCVQQQVWGVRCFFVAMNM